MKLFSAVLLCSAALIPQVSAQLSTSSTSSCITRYSTRPASIRSTGYKSTSSIRSTVTATLTYYRTTTPANQVPVTVTTTAFSTSTVFQQAIGDPTNTVTAIDTVTTYYRTESVFQTRTTSLPGTRITVTQGVTSVSSTPAGFTAVWDAPGFVPRKLAIRGRKVEKRADYPTAITCGTLYLVYSKSTRTVSTTQTITRARPTITELLTSYVVTTETRTRAGSAPTTTLTTNYVVTLTQTFIATAVARSTTTISLPSATVYAICSSNNQLGGANGNFAINRVLPDDSLYEESQNFAQGFEACCQLCASTPDCAGDSASPDGIQCSILKPRTPGYCNASGQSGRYTSLDGVDPSNGYVVGSGQCGWLGNGGVDTA